MLASTTSPAAPATAWQVSEGQPRVGLEPSPRAAPAGQGPARLLAASRVEASGPWHVVQLALHLLSLAPPPQASLGVVEGRCQLRPPAARAAGTAGAGDLCDVGHSCTPDAARIAVSHGRPLGPARWPALRAEASLEKNMWWCGWCVSEGGREEGGSGGRTAS